MRWPKWNGVLLVLLLGLVPPLQGIAKGQEPVPRSEKVTVQEGERVRVRVLQQLSSKTANVGDVFDSEVADDVEVGGKVAVPKGATVLGTITAVQRAAWLGRPGRLGFTFEHARAVDGTRVRLRATTERVGQGSEAAAWGLGLLIFLPLLLIRGQEMEVKPGTVFTAFVDRDAVVAVPLPPVTNEAQPVPIPSPSPTPRETQPVPIPSPPAITYPPTPQPPRAGPPSQRPRVQSVREVLEGRESGAVKIGDMIVLRITTPYDGRHQFQRAEIVAEKLNRLLGQGLKPDEVKSGNLSGTRVILARDEILLPIDAELARKNGRTPADLAVLWIGRIRDALNRLK